MVLRFLGVCKRTKIPFVREYGLAIEWNYEDLTELLEGESDEFVLNHERDKNDAGVIYLKGDLTIKVQNKTRDSWLINFVETIETYVRKTTIDVIRCVVKLINNSTLMNASIFDRFVEVCDSRRNTGCLGYFGNVRTSKRGHFAKECKIKGNQDNRRRDAWNFGNKDGSRTGNKEDSKALVTIDGEGVDWTNHLEEDKDYALMACNSSDSDPEAYSQGLKKVEAQLVAHQQGQLWYEQKIKFMKIDLDDKTDVLTYHKKLLAKAQKEKEDLKAKVEKWHSSSKNLSKLLNTQMSANDKFGLGYGDHRYDGILSYENEVLQSVFMNKESELVKQPLYDRFVTVDGVHAVPPPMTGNYMPSGPDIEVDYSQFIYGPKQTQPSESESQTSEFDTCDSNISTKPSELVSDPVVNESNVECQPKVYLNHLIRDYDFHEKRMARKAELNNGWNNVQRVNKQNQFVPSVVLTRTGKIPVSTARARSTKNFSTARARSTKNFSTARQSFNKQTVLTSTAMKVNTVKPIVNRVRPANFFHKTHSPSSRPFKNTTVLRSDFSKQKVNTAKDYPHRALKNKGIVDSGCSRHMTGNKAYLAEFQDFNGGLVAFGGSKGYITGKDPLFDELLEDTVDHIETENAQDEGRTRDIVDEDKEIEENVLSTEDVLSTNKEKVSTDRPMVSTDGSKISTYRKIEGTDEQVKGTEEQVKGTEEHIKSIEVQVEGIEEHIEGIEVQIESTDGQRKGTEGHTKEGSATQVTQTPTSIIFGDDETIAKVLLNTSQAKVVVREKEKGVELKDIEDTDRPRP
ncbi:hypothetical protein Tco_0919295, partial [Tanacetum coccineum]